SLLSLEAYARQRNEFRAKVIEHKKRRNVHLGEHVLLQFEDELTIRYQVQEMLRIERIFEDAGIQDELDAYNPLIPDGSNWKATMLIEYPEEAERRRMLGLLRGIEQRVWAQVAARERQNVQSLVSEDTEAPPPYTRPADLIEFYVSPTAEFKYFVDASSLSVGADRIVRFTLVARSPSGVDNVSYEGMRCPRENRLYAVARAGGSWSSRDSDWREFAREIGRAHV